MVKHLPPEVIIAMFAFTMTKLWSISYELNKQKSDQIIGFVWLSIAYSSLVWALW